MDNISLILIGLILLALLCFGIAGYMKWTRQPKPDEVQAQFLVTAGCLITLFYVCGIISSLVSIVVSLFRLLGKL